MTASAKQRHDHILAAVLDRRHVSAKDLADSIGVSEATVRRDLKALADEGQLALVYGGATLPRGGDFSYRSKAQRNVEAKRIIGQLAAELVGDDQQLFIDSGTTTSEMTPYLKRRRGLSIIVNSTRLAQELVAPGIGILMVGGQYRPDRMDAVGPLATATLEKLRGYTAFIGADGMSIDFGPTAADIESADVYGRAVQNARETVVLVDHTKFESPSLFKITDWEKVNKLVTDQQPSPQWLEFLRSRNIQPIFPQENGAPHVHAGL